LAWLHDRNPNPAGFHFDNLKQDIIQNPVKPFGSTELAGWNNEIIVSLELHRNASRFLPACTQTEHQNAGLSKNFGCGTFPAAVFTGQLIYAASVRNQK